MHDLLGSDEAKKRSHPPRYSYSSYLHEVKRTIYVSKNTIKLITYANVCLDQPREFYHKNFEQLN